MIHSYLSFEFPFAVRSVKRKVGDWCESWLFPNPLLADSLAVSIDGDWAVNEEAKQMAGLQRPEHVLWDVWVHTQEYGFHLPGGYLVVARPDGWR